MRLFSPQHILSALLASSFAGVLLACSGDDASSGSSTPDSSAPGIGCSQDPRVKTFAAGMQAKSTSGKLVAEILAASPSPPQRGAGDAGINTWTMKITMDGQTPSQPITVKTLMPDHGHGSPKAPVITANPDGTQTVGNLFLFMAGVWEITFAVSSQEAATITLCVE